MNSYCFLCPSSNLASFPVAFSVGALHLFNSVDILRDVRRIFSTSDLLWVCAGAELINLKGLIVRRSSHVEMGSITVRATRSRGAKPRCIHFDISSHQDGKFVKYSLRWLYSRRCCPCSLQVCTIVLPRIFDSRPLPWASLD